jgi:hypothetical protein
MAKKHTTIWKSYGMYSLKEMEQAEQDAREHLKENDFEDYETVDVTDTIYEDIDLFFDDEDIVIATINREDFDRYVADGTIAGGMIPKIENALQAVEAGVGKVVITKATALLGNQGTVISNG